MDRRAGDRNEESESKFMSSCIRITTWVPVLLLLAGCAAAPLSYKPVASDPQRQRGPEAPAPAEQGAAAPSVERIGLPVYEQKAPARARAAKPPASVRRLKGADEPVSIHVNRMLVGEFVIYVLGETMKIPFVMDQAMLDDKRTITLSTPEPLPADQALELVTGVLEGYNFFVEERAGALHVLSKPPASRQAVEIQAGREMADDSRSDILQIVPLRFLRVAEIQTLIADLSRGSVQVKPYARENVLLLQGNGASIRQMLDFVAYFDVPSLQQKKVAFLRLTYWEPEEFIGQLTRVLEGLGVPAARTGKDPGPLFIAIRQMNAVLAIAPDETTLQQVLEWQGRLDTVEAAGSDEKAYTFAPQYSRASDIVNAILALYGEPSPSGTAAQARESSPRSTAARSTAAGTGLSAQPSDTLAANPAGGASARTGTQGSAPAGSLPGLRIAADNNKNIVIMVCSPTVYRQHLDLLRQLDTQAKQVLIEATIAELTLTDELKYGVEWYLRNTYDGGPYTGGTLGNLTINTLGATFSYATSTANFTTMLNAFATKDKANILSTPRLTVLDNHEAVIQIGQDVPVATGEQTTTSSTTANPTILRTIQYRSLGIILKVKPTINSEGLLTLELTQEVSDLSQNTGVGDSPIILVRRINTSIVAAHGQTVALGGLIREKKGTAERKVPLLGDIPVIGNLFKVTEDATERTELLVLVTPTILTKTDDATKITDELKRELKWMKF